MQNPTLVFVVLQYLSQKVVAPLLCSLYLFGLNTELLDSNGLIEFLLL